MGFFRRLFGGRAGADPGSSPGPPGAITGAAAGTPIFDPDHLDRTRNLAEAINARRAGTAPRQPEAVAWVKVDRRGGIQLNGRAASLDELKAGLARVRQARGGVAYYREAPEAGALPAARAAIESTIQAITDEHLPVNLLDEDFDGPRPPYMPAVDPDRVFAECLDPARRLSAGRLDAPGVQPGQRHVVIVTPDRLSVPVCGHPPEVVTPARRDDLRRFVPPEPKRNVTVIAFTAVAVWTGVPPTGRQINALIPFLGYLMGMASDGHTVVAFEGHPSAFRDGCRDADLLVVDGAMADHLPGDWVATATAEMRTPAVLIFGRDGSVLEPGPAGAPGRLVGTRRGEWDLPPV